MEKVVDITAKRDGFRRAGMKHSDVTQTYPLSQFTREQLEQLQAEPMLVVAIRDKDAAGAADVVTGLRQQLEDVSGLLTVEQQKNSELTTELDSERQMVTQLNNDLTAERETVAQLNSDLAAERQTVADLTVKLTAAEKAAKKEK